MAERQLSKLLAIMDNPCHPLHDIIRKHRRAQTDPAPLSQRAEQKIFFLQLSSINGFGKTVLILLVCTFIFIILFI